MTRRDTLKRTLIAMLAAATRNLFAQGSPQIQRTSVAVPLVDGTGSVVAHYNASTTYFVEDLGAGASLDISLIPAGDFEMGSPLGSVHSEESPPHTVQVQTFGLSTNPITIGQWRQVSTFPKINTDLHFVSRGPLPLEVENSLPIDFVALAEANEFCARLKNFSGRAYRLPSEGEWEYACRAGTTTQYNFGDGISVAVANFNDGITRPLALSPVGSKQAPNRFGLNDMHGNVEEWCSDTWHDSYIGAPTDGSSWGVAGPSSSAVTRGGCFLFDADVARSRDRFRWDGAAVASGFGFRVASQVPVVFVDPLIEEGGIVNLASRLSGSIVPGQIISIRGQFGVSDVASLTLDNQGIALSSLLDVRVLINDLPAPLLMVSSTEVQAVVPYEISSLVSAWVAVESKGQTSQPQLLNIAEASPGLFTLDSSGRGQAAAINENGSLNNASSPAQQGTIITLFATGEGQTSPPGITGSISASPLPTPIQDVQVLIGGISAVLQYAGEAPAEIAGLLQINARVPVGLSPGLQAVVLMAGEINSQQGVFISVA